MWRKIVEYAKDWLIPEQTKIKKLLSIPADTMRDLLPQSPVFVKNIFVLFDYQSSLVRLIVKSIKYKDNIGMRKRIAKYLCEEIIEICSDKVAFEGALPIIVPMPMSKKEKRKRGFNQCEELCREIKKIGGDMEVSFVALKKIRETARQTEMDRKEREENVKNSMEAYGKDVNKKSAIVIDDVYTTGASFAEARRALLAAGAKSVYGLFIAH